MLIQQCIPVRDDNYSEKRKLNIIHRVHKLLALVRHYSALCIPFCSVGIENIEDLMLDLKQALDKISWLC